MSEESKEERTDIEERLSDMSIWQDHEKRITTLELTTADMRQEFKEVKDKIDDGNSEQIKKLDSFYTRLADDFFQSKQNNAKYKWKFATKFVGALIGGGGIVYLIIEKIMEAM